MKMWYQADRIEILTWTSVFCNVENAKSQIKDADVIRSVSQRRAYPLLRPFLHPQKTEAVAKDLSLLPSELVDPLPC